MKSLIFFAVFSTAAVALGAELSPLPFRVVDAEYSESLDRIVMVSASPSQLHIYDGATRTETATVDLPTTPSSVSVGPDGHYAAVGHNAWISYVNLSTAKLEKTLPISIDVLDVVLAGNGYAYGFPRRDQWARVAALNLQTGAEAPHTGMSIYAGTLGKLHPGGKAIYGANNGLSPSDIEKYDISAGPVSYLYDSPYHGDYAMCGNLWMSKDGLRIFTRCGNVFRSSEVRDQDMRYNGALQGMHYLTWVAHSLSGQRVAAIDGGSSYYQTGSAADTKVNFYDYDFLNYKGSVTLPRFQAPGNSYAAHGRFVFASADGSKFFVVTQADANSGLLMDYAVTSVSASEATGTSPCSYSVTPSSPRSFGAAGGSFTASIQSDTGCVWTVSGLPSWISSAAAQGSGSGNVYFTVASNTTGQARSADISIAETPFTIIQQGCTYSLSQPGQLFSAQGGTGSVNVSTTTGCTWTASSDVDWISVTAGSTGTGNGRITYQVAANPAAARTGTLTIAGLAYTVQESAQAAPGESAGGSISHIAAGGDWRTTITLINTGTFAASFRLSFFQDSGSPMSLPLGFPQSATTLAATPFLERTLEPGATLVVVCDGVDLRTGWAQLTTGGPITAFAIFGWKMPGYDREALVPLGTRNAASYLLPFDNTSGLVTAMSVANLAAAPANIVVTIRDDKGAAVSVESIWLPALGHSAFVLAERFPKTSGDRGTLELRTPDGGRIDLLGLRFNPGAFTTIPVLPQ
jgi:hypothetical protein